MSLKDNSDIVRCMKKHIGPGSHRTQKLYQKVT